MTMIVPLSGAARTARPRDLFAIWYARGLGLVPFGVGVVAASPIIGMGWWDGLVAIVIGTAVGAALVGLLAARGAPQGVPQLAVASVVFGRAIALPAALTWVGLAAWAGIDTILGGDALVELTGDVLPLWVGFVAVGLAVGALAFVGFSAVCRYQRLAAVVQSALFALVTLALLGKVDVGLSDAYGASAGSFVLMAAVAAGLPVAWAVTASDYASHAVPGTPATSIFLATFAGLLLSTVWLEALGVAVALAVPTANEPVRGFYLLLGGGAPGVIGLVAVALGIVGANSMLVFSGSLALLAGGPGLPRQVVAGVTAAVGVALAVGLDALAAQAWLANILLIGSYWIPPWAAVVLLGRSRPVDATGPPVGTPGNDPTRPWGANAALALLVGFAAALPFVDQELLLGPGANFLSGADLGYVTGFLAAGVVFVVLERIRPTRDPTPAPTI